MEEETDTETGWFKSELLTLCKKCGYMEIEDFSFDYKENGDLTFQVSFESKAIRCVDCGALLRFDWPYEVCSDCYTKRGSCYKHEQSDSIRVPLNEE